MRESRNTGVLGEIGGTDVNVSNSLYIIYPKIHLGLIPWR